MATAWRCGLPASISRRMLVDTALREAVFTRGIRTLPAFWLPQPVYRHRLRPAAGAHHLVAHHHHLARCREHPRRRVRVDVAGAADDVDVGAAVQDDAGVRAGHDAPRKTAADARRMTPLTPNASARMSAPFPRASAMVAMSWPVTHTPYIWREPATGSLRRPPAPRRGRGTAASCA